MQAIIVRTNVPGRRSYVPVVAMVRDVELILFGRIDQLLDVVVGTQSWISTVAFRDRLTRNERCEGQETVALTMIGRCVSLSAGPNFFGRGSKIA